MSRRAGLTLLVALAAALTGCRSTAPAAASRPRQIFAHYMGCFPVASNATQWARDHADELRHDSTDYQTVLGGKIRHWPLVPTDMRLNAEASAELEIRRALRIGIDGFAIDAWAGGDHARQSLDALFKVAEEQNLPFQVTICLDQSCHKKEPGVPAPESVIAAFTESIRWLLDKHGDSPKLARRDGKPLIFGYSSRITPRLKGPEDEATWPAIAEAYREIERRVGTPLFMHFAMEHFFSGCDLNRWPGARPPHQPGPYFVQAASLMAANFPAVGAFTDSDMYPDLPAMAEAVKAQGAEWCQPMWHQYQNCLGSLSVQPGTDILRDRWRLARESGSTLIQYVTWNDYGEATNLAPDYLTRYTVNDLNGYFIRWWKEGRPPRTDHDRLYLVYRAYPKDAPVFPFRTRRSAAGVLEVVTWLPKAATVRLPGRPESWQAPAGLSAHQVPLRVGAVSAELVRRGKVVLRVDSPEPVTDRPFREENAMICYSSEFERLWREDFGDAPRVTASMYGDADGDGLPNWFEMYWFGKFLDWSTATAADPAADPDGDGQTNLQEYLAQSDPTKAPPVYPVGYAWDVEDIARRGTSFNPDNDAAGTPVWRYLYRLGNPPIALDAPWLACPHSAPKTGYTGILVHSAPYRDDAYKSVYGWFDRLSRGEDKTDGYRLRLLPRTNCLLALEWTSPVKGVVAVDALLAPDSAGKAISLVVARPEPWEELARVDLDGKGGAVQLPRLAVEPGSRLLFVADSHGGNVLQLLFDRLVIRRVE